MSSGVERSVPDMSDEGVAVFSRLPSPASSWERPAAAAGDRSLWWGGDSGSWPMRCPLPEKRSRPAAMELSDMDEMEVKSGL